MEVDIQKGNTVIAFKKLMDIYLLKGRRPDTFYKLISKCFYVFDKYEKEELSKFRDLNKDSN